MHADLIVITFDGGEMAQTVHDSLQVMRTSQVLGLDDTAIVTKDGTGQVRLCPEPEAGTGLAGLLGDLIFRCPSRDVPAGVWENVDDEFLRLVGAALRNNGSALLFFLHPDSLSDRVELLHALAMFRGAIHQTTLPPQSEVRLRGML